MAAVGEVSVVVWHCAAQRWSVAGVAVHRLCSAVTARTYRITTGLLPPFLPPSAPAIHRLLPSGEVRRGSGTRKWLKKVQERSPWRKR